MISLILYHTDDDKYELEEMEVLEDDVEDVMVQEIEGDLPKKEILQRALSKKFIFPPFQGLGVLPLSAMMNVI
jgi:hypothetical protein